MKLFIRLKKSIKDDLLQRIIKNSGIVLFGNGVASVINLLSFTIIAQQIGPKYLGILVLAQTYTVIINDILNVQTWESLIKFGSMDTKSSSIVNVIKTNLFLDVISAIFAFVVSLILIKSVVHLLNWDISYIKVCSLYSFSILFNLTSFTIGIPRLFDKFSSLAKISVILAIFRFGLIIWAMVFANLLDTYIYIFLGAEILGNVVLIIYSTILLRKKYGAKWWGNKFTINRDQIKFIWWTNLRSIIRIPVQRFDMIVISSVISIQMVGVYKVYKEVAGFINRLGMPINQTIFPEFTKLIANNDLSKAAIITKKTMSMLFVVGFFVCVGLLFLSKFIIGTFFGEFYLNDINVLYWMIVLFTLSFMTIPINSLFIAAGFAKYSFFIILFSNIIYLISAFGCGTLFGIYGLIIAFGLQIFINKGFKIFFLTKFSNEWGNSIR